jgi:hypothetical protein
MADHYDYLLKVVLIGDSKVDFRIAMLHRSPPFSSPFPFQVGKTSIFRSYSDGVFNETFIATIGVDFLVTLYDSPT